MITITDEYRQYAKKFKEKFGYGVPLSMIPQTTTTEELIKNIIQCVENGKDDLLLRYGVAEDEADRLY